MPKPGPPMRSPTELARYASWRSRNDYFASATGLGQRRRSGRRGRVDGVEVVLRPDCDFLTPISQWIELGHGGGRCQGQPARARDAGRGDRCPIGRAWPAVDRATVVIAHGRVVDDGGPPDDDGEHHTAGSAHAKRLAGPQGTVKHMDSKMLHR